MGFVDVIDLRIPEKYLRITMFLFCACVAELTEWSRGGSYCTLIIPVVAHGSISRACDAGECLWCGVHHKITFR